MNGNASEEKDFAGLKNYARFIYNKHLPEASTEFIKIAREIKLPLLKLHIVLTAEEIAAFLKENFKSFLYQIFSGEVLLTAEETMRKWKADELPGIPKNKVKAADIVLVYSARKQVFLTFLSRYTKDPESIIQVVREMENLHAKIEEMAFATFLEIQQEEQQILHTKLKETQAGLQAANEELRQNHKELQASNKELTEQIQKRAAIEKSLEKERNYLKAILENVSDGIVACNEEGVLSFFNDATRHFHGLPEEAVPAEDWATHYNLYHPDGKTLLKKEEIPLFRAYGGENVKNAEMVISPLHGKERVLLATGRQIISSEGENLGAVVVMHDITEEKKARKEISDYNRELTMAVKKLKEAEQQLKEANNELEKRVQERTDELAASEEELRMTLENTLELSKKIEERERFLSDILDQTPVSTWIADAEGTQIRVNEACLKLFNVHDPEAGLGKYNILKDETLTGKPFFRDIEAVFKEGKTATFETEYNLGEVEHVNISTGKEVVVVATIFPVKDNNGRVTHAVIQHEDVTDKKQAEKALRESELLFRTIANAAPVTLWMSDTEGGISYVNQTWIDWTGKPSDQHLGRGWISSILPEDREQLEAQYMQAFQLRQQYYSEFRILHQNGEIRWCVAYGVPRYLASGGFAGYVGSCVDITERKLAEKALQTKNNELEKINADLDNFVYTASHDLKSPISNIEGLTLLLEKKLKGRIENPEQKILEMIGLSVSRFKRTIGDLTEIAKVQKNFDYEMEEISFKEVLEDVKNDIQEMIVLSGASLREELTVNSFTYARHNLRSILYNLMSNAIKYASPERPLQIDIISQQVGKDIILSVKDNGLGISENNLPKLFTMFKRLHTHVEGTGIGLYMIKRIVENKGGKIEVESKLNHGTCFRVYFSSTPKH